MQKNYAKLENTVLSQFIENQKIQYQNKEFLVLLSGKPKTNKGGEPKTDCYIKLKDLSNEKIHEYKISCKLKSSNEFQENKIRAERAEEILGPNWKNIITKTSTKIDNLFKERPLNNPNGYKQNKYGHLVLGWKIEIASKERLLSAELELSEQKIKDYIYKGTNQKEVKKNSYINNIKVKDSGIANYILIAEIEDINSPKDVLDKIIDIDKHKIKKHYLIFTGNTYNVNKPKNKTDGNRSLAVRIEWELKNDELYPNIKYDSPLTPPSNSKDMRKIIDKIFEKHPRLKDKYL